MLKVQVNQKDLSHVLACIDKLKVLVTEELRKSIPEQCAREFSSLLKSNIAGSAKYAGVFKALTRWKRTEPNAGLFWKWTGVTESLVSFHKIDDSTWFAGWGTIKTKGAPSVSRREKIAESVKKRQKKVASPTVVKRNKFTGQLEKVQVNKPVEDKEVKLNVKKVLETSNTKVFSEMNAQEKAAYLEQRNNQLAFRQQQKAQAGGFTFGHEPIKKHIDTQRN